MAKDYSGVTVLVVDDLPLNVMLMEKMLKRYGFNLNKAGGGQEALDFMATTRPDIVLLDLMMPVVSGTEVIKRMRSDERLRDVRVIFFSALNDEEDVKNGLDAGADDYITKPVNMASLYAVVDKQLAALGYTE